MELQKLIAEDAVIQEKTNILVFLLSVCSSRFR